MKSKLILELTEELKRNEISIEEYEKKLKNIVSSSDKSEDLENKIVPIEEKEEEIEFEFSDELDEQEDELDNFEQIEEIQEQNDIENDQQEVVLFEEDEIEEKKDLADEKDKKQELINEIQDVINSDPNLPNQNLIYFEEEKLNNDIEVNSDIKDGVDLAKVDSFNENERIKQNKDPIIVVGNLSKSVPFKKKKMILDDVSFNVYPGEFHVLIGPNGAGKTTTIKLIVGSFSKYRAKGNIFIKGKKNDNLSVKKMFGYIPEKAIFPKNISLSDYLILFAKLSGYEADVIDDKVNEVIRKFNLEDLVDKKPFDFSSGEKQKLLLAQAMISDPEILIMDEPSANLDPQSTHELFEFLRKIQKQGKTILLSSHNLSEVNNYATYCTILKKGKVIFDGPFDKQKTNLTNLYTQVIDTRFVKESRE